MTPPAGRSSTLQRAGLGVQRSPSLPGRNHPSNHSRISEFDFPFILPQLLGWGVRCLSAPQRDFTAHTLFVNARALPISLPGSGRGGVTGTVYIFNGVGEMESEDLTLQRSVEAQSRRPCP